MELLQMKVPAVLLLVLAARSVHSDYVSTSYFSDAACTVAKQPSGVSLTRLPVQGCGSFSPACTPSEGGGWSKGTCAAGTIPAPTSPGVWLTVQTSSDCTGAYDTATQMMPTGSCFATDSPPNGPASAKFVCTQGGGAQMWGYTSGSCGGDPAIVQDLASQLPASLRGQLGGGAMGSCNAVSMPGSTLGMKLSCLGAEVAPLPVATGGGGGGGGGGSRQPAVPATCSGSAIATAPASSGIACFEGVQFTAGNATWARLTAVELSSSNAYKFCVAVTAECKNREACRGVPRGTTVRLYSGVDAADITSLYATAAQMFGNARDLQVCTSAGCNSPFTDPCKMAGFGSLMCGGGAPALPEAAANDIKCFDGLALQDTATAGNKHCVAFSTFCGDARGRPTHPLCPTRNGYPVNGTIRARFPLVKFAAMLTQFNGTDVPATPLGLQGAFRGLFGYSLTTTAFGPGNGARKVISDLVICNTAACNGGAADTCAPAERPVQAKLKFSGVPAGKFEQTAGGRKALKAEAVAVLASSIEAAVQAGTCATCTVTLQQVVEDATGTVVYEAPAAGARRLQNSGVTVTFATSGGSTDQLAAVTAATTSPSFSAAVTGTVAAAPGYETVAAESAPAELPAAAAALGLLGILAVLLLVVPIAWFCHKKYATAAAPGKTAPALVINSAPAGAVVVVQGGQGGNPGTGV